MLELLGQYYLNVSIFLFKYKSLIIIRGDTPVDRNGLWFLYSKRPNSDATQGQMLQFRFYRY